MVRPSEKAEEAEGVGGLANVEEIVAAGEAVLATRLEEEGVVRSRSK